MTEALSGTSVKNKLFIGIMLLFSISLALSKSAMNITIGIAYLAACYYAVTDRSFRTALKGRLTQPLLVPLGLYLLVALIGIAFTEKPADGLGIVNKMVGMVLVYLMISVLLDLFVEDKRAGFRAEHLVSAYLVGIAVLDLIALMTYAGFVGHKKFLLPLAPLHVHHIWFSNLNAIGFYAAAGFLLFSRSIPAREKVLYGLFMFLSLVCIALSLSRTAWFGLLLTIVIMTAILSFLTRNGKPFVLVLLVIAVASTMLYLASPFVQYRIHMISSDVMNYLRGNEQTSLGARFLMWKAAFQMFLSNPLIGVGTGDYVTTMNKLMSSGQLPAFLAEYNQPHNMYLFALATNGLPGLAVLFFIFYRIFSLSLPLLREPEPGRRVLAFLAVATAVHFLIAGMTDSFFNIQLLRYTFAFVTGVCIRKSLIAA